MAVIINQNIPSMTAQRYLGNANSSVAKSITKLSSGLRINSAADDASGLAISEKLRGQISGLKQASMNAQNGISMLQTAEGGLQNVQDMLQRMRELSVQGANGIYTSNDRAEIQKEMDQLKDEINRTSAATEFNTKKLLNGDASALWSSSSADISTIVRGNVAEGNYQIDVTATAGTNDVYKTDVMTVSRDISTVDVYGVASGGGTVSGVTTVGNFSDSFDTELYNRVKIEVNDQAGGNSVFAALNDRSFYSQSALGSTLTAIGTDFTISAGNFSGYVHIEFEKNISIASLDAFVDGSNDDASAAGTALAQAAKVTVYDHSGDIITESMVDVMHSADTVTTTGTSFDFTLDMSSVNNAVAAALKDDGVTNYSTTFDNVDLGTLAVDTSSVTTDSLAANVFVGDQVLEAFRGDFDDDTASASLDGAEVTLYHPAADSATAINSSLLMVYFDSGLARSTETFAYMELDEDDGTLSLDTFDMTFAADDDGDMLGNENVFFTGDSLAAGDVANTDTALKDIARFTNADGRNIFDNTQSLTIYGNGSSAEIFLEGDDTIADMETKLSDAIVSLGMGDTADARTNQHLVDYVETASVNNTDQAVAGTFVIQSALLGDDSELSFVGDQALIDGFSLAQIQDGENSQLSVTVTDAHTGEAVGEDTINDYTLKNVIEGVDVELSSGMGVSVASDASGNFTFSSVAGGETAFLHLVDNSTELQIGANEGQTLSVSIGQLDTKSLDIEEALVVTQDAAQKSITKIDNALNSVSSTRATIGAQINRLEYTITGLDTARENLSASESRIRDLDIASEMAEFTKQQILSQSSTAMLSQANQLPQMALQLLG